MYKTPILFVVFNRPESTFQVFERIKEIKPKKLYIAADGPREQKTGERELCENVRSVTQNIDWECEIKILFQDNNLGCKKGVETAINWFFENEEMGIILEDDCLPSIDFFSFCQDLLERYKNDARIMAISGRNNLGKFKSDYSYLYSRLFREWGWATWRRSWNFYSTTNEDLKNKQLPNIALSLFEDPVKSKYYIDCLNSVLLDNHDTWDYVWAYRILLNNGLIIVPSVNLVYNIGLNSGTHFGNNVQIRRELYDVPIYTLDKKLIHPQFVFADAHFDDKSFRTLFPYLYIKKYTLIDRLKDSLEYRFLSKLKRK